MRCAFRVMVRVVVSWCGLMSHIFFVSWVRREGARVGVAWYPLLGATPSY